MKTTNNATFLTQSTANKDEKKVFKTSDPNPNASGQPVPTKSILKNNVNQAQTEPL
jgi:hypothetical protein